VAFQNVTIFAGFLCDTSEAKLSDISI